MVDKSLGGRCHHKRKESQTENQEIQALYQAGTRMSQVEQLQRCV